MNASTVAMDDVRTLEELYAALGTLGAKAGWERAGNPGLEPRPAFRPAHWRYNEMRPALDAAGRLVDTELAERRNLLLVNPGAGGRQATAATMIVAYQMILAGERARSHRHTPNALRFVLDTPPGVYTVVDGVRYDMAPGDVVLTPNWCWHGHANDGDATGIWLDYLDVPLTVALEPMFFEPFPGDYQVSDRSGGEPFLYRWSDVEARLKLAPPEPSGGYGRQIALDAYRFPTLGLFVCALDAGTRTTAVRTTANNVYTVVSGRGRSTVGDQSFVWERGDVFVAPAWQEHHHEPNGDAVLFRLTDAPLLAALNWLR